MFGEKKEIFWSSVEGVVRGKRQPIEVLLITTSTGFWTRPSTVSSPHPSPLRVHRLVSFFFFSLHGAQAQPRRSFQVTPPPVEVELYIYIYIYIWIKTARSDERDLAPARGRSRAVVTCYDGTWRGRKPAQGIYIYIYIYIYMYIN